MLSRKPFHVWLAQQLPMAIVGYSNRPQVCPLASYLRQSSGMQNLDPVRIGVTSSYYRIGQQEYPIPPWAIAFLRTIDARSDNQPITAQEAYNVLRSIPS